MDIENRTNMVKNVSFTKTYSDFSTAALTNSIDLVTGLPSIALLSIEAEVTQAFTNSLSHLRMNLSDDLIIGMNLTNINNNQIRSLVDNPYMAPGSSESFGVWTIANDLNTARNNLGGAGTQSSGLCFGGNTGSYSAVTEEYDGTNWTASNNMNTARQELAGCGTQSAGLSFGGYIATAVATTEEYDGTSWAAASNLNTARHYLTGFGTQTAGVSAVGQATINVATTEEYDGTSWAVANDSNEARRILGGCGTQSAGLIFGGYISANVDTVEEYDGTSWVIAVSLNNILRAVGGCGTQSAGLSFGGNNNVSFVSLTEEYDGTSWTSVNDMNTSIAYMAGIGTQSAGLSAGGYISTYSAITEEYNDTSPVSSIQLNVESTGIGAWTIGGDIGTDCGGWAGAGDGTQSDSIVTGGNLNGSGANAGVLVCKEYDGTSWSSANNILTATWSHFCIGNTSSALEGGGFPGGSAIDDVNEYDGTSWTVAALLLSNITSMGAAGTPTSGIIFGGSDGSNWLSSSNEYDGTSWTVGNSLNIARSASCGCGTQNSTLSVSGVSLDSTEEHDGTSWTISNSLNVFKRTSCCGSLTAALSVAGYADSTLAYLTDCEEYDGTSWMSCNSSILPRYTTSSSGTQSTGLVFGGYEYGLVTLSEHYDKTTPQNLNQLTAGSIKFNLSYIEY